MNKTCISIDDSEYGLKRLKRKVVRLKRKIKWLEEREPLSRWGGEELGRYKEAIDIYEELIEFWERGEWT